MHSPRNFASGSIEPEYPFVAVWFAVVTGVQVANPATNLPPREPPSDPGCFCLLRIVANGNHLEPSGVKAKRRMRIVAALASNLGASSRRRACSFSPQAVAAQRTRIECDQGSFLFFRPALVASVGSERVASGKRGQVLLLVLKDPSRWSHLRWLAAVCGSRVTALSFATATRRLRRRPCLRQCTW